ncbi:MAG: SDR family NAD(P)-dependent oxidoreductase [Paracoccaceae bacterium]
MSRGTVLITGASRGIGRAMVARAAAEGYEVVGVSRARPDGFEGIHYPVDLAQPAARDALAQIAATHTPGRLIANAGIVTVAGIDDVTDAEFEATYRVNVQAVLWAIQACLAPMTDDRFGRIVTLGSRAALGKAGRVAYASSKAAVTGLTRTLALELAPRGITVNCVAPGPIDTEMFATDQPPGSPARAALVGAVPLGRMGTAEEVAHAALHFLSDGAGYTTGQTLHVCGGLSVGGMGA